MANNAAKGRKKAASIMKRADTFPERRRKQNYKQVAMIIPSSSSNTTTTEGINGGRQQPDDERTPTSPSSSFSSSSSQQQHHHAHKMHQFSREDIMLDDLRRLGTSFGRKGALAMDEFVAVIHGVVGDSLTETQLRSLFMKIDANNDGSVDWDEFTNHLFFLNRGAGGSGAEDDEGDCDFEARRCYGDTDAGASGDLFVLTNGTRHIMKKPMFHICLHERTHQYITAQQDGCVRFWQMGDLAHVRTLHTAEMNTRTRQRKSNYWLTAVALMPKTNCLATASVECGLTFYDLRSCVKANQAVCGRIPRADIAQAAVTCMISHYNADNEEELLLTGSDAGGVMVMRCDTHVRLQASGWHYCDGSLPCHTTRTVHHVSWQRYNVHNDQITDIAFAQELNLVLTASLDRTVKAVQLSTGALHVAYNGHAASVYSLAWSKSANVVISSGRSSSLQVWSPVTGHTLTQFIGHTAPVHKVIVNERGRHSVGFSPQCISASHDLTIRVWDIRQAVCMQTIPMGSASSLFFDSKNDVLLAGSDKLFVFPVFVKEEKPTRTHQKRPLSAIFNGQFNQVISGDEGSTISVWNCATGDEIVCFNVSDCDAGGGGTANSDEAGESHLTAMCLDSSGRRLITGTETGRELKIWNFNSGMLLKTLIKEKGVRERLLPELFNLKHEEHAVQGVLCSTSTVDQHSFEHALRATQSMTRKLQEQRSIRARKVTDILDKPAGDEGDDTDLGGGADLFQAMDKDGDGTIDAEEMKAADTDGDGKVDVSLLKTAGMGESPGGFNSLHSQSSVRMRPRGRTAAVSATVMQQKSRRIKEMKQREGENLAEKRSPNKQQRSSTGKNISAEAVDAGAGRDEKTPPREVDGVAKKKADNNQEWTQIRFVVSPIPRLPGHPQLENRFIVAAGWDRRVYVWNDSSKDTEAERGYLFCMPEDNMSSEGHTDDILALEFCPPSTLATGGHDGRVIFWHLNSGTKDREIRATGSVSSMIFLERCNLLVAATQADGDKPVKFNVIDRRHISSLFGDIGLDELDTGSESTTVDVEAVTALATDTKDNDHIFVADSKGWLRVCDVLDPQRDDDPYIVPYTQWRAHPCAVVSVDYVEDSRALDTFLVSAGTDGNVCMWTLNGALVGIYGCTNPWAMQDPSTFRCDSPEVTNISEAPLAPSIEHYEQRLTQQVGGDSNGPSVQIVVGFGTPHAEGISRKTVDFSDGDEDESGNRHGSNRGVLHKPTPPCGGHPSGDPVAHPGRNIQALLDGSGDAMFAHHSDFTDESRKGPVWQKATAGDPKPGEVWVCRGVQGELNGIMTINAIDAHGSGGGGVVKGWDGLVNDWKRHDSSGDVAAGRGSENDREGGHQFLEIHVPLSDFRDSPANTEPPWVKHPQLSARIGRIFHDHEQPSRQPYKVYFVLRTQQSAMWYAIDTLFNWHPLPPLTTRRADKTMARSRAKHRRRDTVLRIGFDFQESNASARVSRQRSIKRTYKSQRTLPAPCRPHSKGDDTAADEAILKTLHQPVNACAPTTTGSEAKRDPRPSVSWADPERQIPTTTFVVSPPRQTFNTVKQEIQTLVRSGHRVGNMVHRADDDRPIYKLNEMCYFEFGSLRTALKASAGRRLVAGGQRHGKGGLHAESVPLPELKIMK